MRRKPSPHAHIQITVVLRSRCSETAMAEAVRRLTTQQPRDRVLPDSRTFERLYGADPAAIAIVKSFARRHALTVSETSARRCCVVLSGTLAAFARAFRTRFDGYEDDGGSYRSHATPVRLPAEMAAIVLTVLGLDDRPLMQRHAALSPGATSAGVDPRTVARVYGFPPDFDARGQTVALIELGGGFHRSDVKKFAAWHQVQMPRIRVRSIDGHRNRPAPARDIGFVLQKLGLPASKQAAAPQRVAPVTNDRALRAMWTIETSMDIQLVSSLARGAIIDVYFAPGTSHGQYHAFTAALERRDTSVISCSFGSCEDEMPPAFLRAMSQALQLAALRGVTVCVSSGDHGDDAKDGKPRAHFPATSPFVLGCGGTHMDPMPPFRERVWEEPGMPSLKSGGGVSHVFPEPAWQSRARVAQKTSRSGRGVPDVAAKADLRAGYGIVAGGSRVPMGGTSAAAPLWAALIATLNKRLGVRIGYLTPLLYARRFSRATRDITRGSNGEFFRAGPGWDPCTGLGSPDGTALRQALEGN